MGKNNAEMIGTDKILESPLGGGPNHNTFLIIALQDLPTLPGQKGRSSSEATGLTALVSLDASKPKQKTEPQAMSPSSHSHHP